jgi:hypothetical protein
MPAPKTIKTLILTLDTEVVECNLTGATLTDEPEGAETLTTFCGAYDVAGTPKYTLALAGFQSYDAVDDVCSILHTAYVAEPRADLDVVMTVGTKTRTFTATPAADPPFGGEAGAALTFETTLNVTSDITDGVVTP